MGVVGPGNNQSASGGQIVYPAQHMRETAAKILAEVNLAQSQHDTAWGQFQNSVSQNCAPDLQDTMMNCVKPYGDRLRSSYDWLISLATALFQAADAIEQAEGQITQSLSSPRIHGPF